MKKITILSFLIGSLVFGQDFFSSGSDQNDEEPQQSSFSHHADYSQPNQGAEAGPGTGNPGDPVPINGGWVLLALSGIAIGIYWLNSKRKIA